MFESKIASVLCDFIVSIHKDFDLPYRTAQHISMDVIMSQGVPICFMWLHGKKPN